MVKKILFVVLMISFPLLPQDFKWEKMTEPFGGGVYRIFAKGDTLLAAGGRNFYYSTDRGENWLQVRGYEFYDFTFTKDGGFAASGKGGMYKTKNLVTWTRVYQDLSTADLMTDTTGNIYAATRDYTMRSTNNGNSWSLYYYYPNSSVLLSEPYIFLMSNSELKRKNLYNEDQWVTIPVLNAPYKILKGNGPHLYYYGGDSRIYYSFDYGDTWNSLLADFPDMHPREVLWDNYTIIIKSSNWTNKVYRSDDNGKTWNSLTGLIAGTTHIISSGGDFFANAEGYGVIKSTDMGVSWQPLYKGINDLSITGIITGRNNIIYASTSGRGVLKSEDSGITWQEMNEGLSTNVVWDLVITGSGDLFAINKHRVFRWDENIRQWIMTNFPEVLNLSLMSDGSEKIYAKDHRVLHVSDDKGNTWKNIYTRDSIWQFSADTKGNLFVTAFTRPYSIIRSTDGGMSWKDVYKANRIYGSVTDDRGTLYLNADSGIIKSTDGGENWKYIPNDVHGQIYADGKGNLFCAGWSLYHSSDEGLTWRNVTGGISNLNNRIWNIHFTNGKMLIGTDYGMWTKNNYTIASGSDEQIPSEYSLMQNYPNPFNPNTTITFSIPQQSFATLKIYDILGREAAVLVDEEKPAGTFTINFDAASLPSGIYIYELNAAGKSLTRKMLLIK